MATIMTGQFKLVGSNNFIGYLEAIGVIPAIIVPYAAANPTVTITNEGDEWNIHTYCSYFNPTQLVFRLGVEFDEITADHRICKTLITQEGDDKLVQVQRYQGEGNITSTIVREFTHNRMTMRMEGPGGVVSTRIFKKPWFSEE